MAKITQPLEVKVEPPTPKDGQLTSEFWAMVARFVVAVLVVTIGAFSGTEHSELLIMAGISLLGVDAGFYTLARTYIKVKTPKIPEPYYQLPPANATEDAKTK